MSEPVLQTKRLILRPLSAEDGKDMYEQISHDEDVLRYFMAPYKGEYDETYMMNLVDYYLKNNLLALAVTLKETGEFIGIMVQQAHEEENEVEMGYALGKKYWNRGYGSEALKEVLNWLLQHRCDRVICGYLSGNRASGRIMEKAGMHYSHTVAQSIEYRGAMFDEIVYVKENCCILPGRYRHFKGKEYEVIATARHSESEEQMVIYRPLYNDSGLWVRPAWMFNEIIDKDGVKTRRFEYIGEMKHE